MLAPLFCVHRLLPAGTLILRRGLPSVIALRGIAAARGVFRLQAYLPLLQRERGLAQLGRRRARPRCAGLVRRFMAAGPPAARGWSRQQLLRVGTVMMTVGIAATLAVLFNPMPLPVRWSAGP
jgi:hypothetical protein